MSGMCLPPQISVRSDSIEISESFEVSVGCQWSNVEKHGATFIVKKSVTTSWLARQRCLRSVEVWVPGYSSPVWNTLVHVAQQKEGRCETSRSMLDLSVSGLIHIVATIGGWMNVVGSMHAEVLPVRCEETLGSPED